MNEIAACSLNSFASTKEALAYLDSLAEKSATPLLFRGEGNRYPTSVPSLYRLPEKERLAVGAFIASLALHFWSDILWPSVKFKSEGLYFEGELLGDLHVIEQVRSAPSYLNVQHQFVPLFQHYGWPTPWLDVSYDPRVALFFASFDFNNQQFISNGMGYVYYWDQPDLRKTAGFIDIVDLKHLARLLSHALHVEGTRPGRQDAVSIRIGASMGSGLSNQDQLIASARHCVTFNRHDIQDSIPGYDHYFPRDQLKELLEAYQRKYLRWAERYNQGKSLDHRIDTELGQRLERRAADEQSLYWERCGLDYDIVERYRDRVFDLAYHGQIITAASKFLSQADNTSGLSYEQFEQILRAWTGEQRYNL